MHRLLDTADAVLVQQDCPMEGAPVDGMDLRSWSRLPNGTGSFAIGLSTPGEPNAAP